MIMDKKWSTKLSRRTVLKGAAAAAAAPTMFNINHTWSKDVMWDGQPFNAGGAVLRMAEWGGFWEESVRKYLLPSFEKDYNCKIAWDSSFPWFAKFAAGGPKSPPYGIANWNLKDMYQTARAGDFFLPLDDVLPKVLDGTWKGQEDVEAIEKVQEVVARRWGVTAQFIPNTAGKACLVSCRRWSRKAQRRPPGSTKPSRSSTRSSRASPRACRSSKSSRRG
jgi:spermidine/putrescine-binding protein